MDTKSPYSSYAEYLRHPKYRAVRAEAMRRDSYTCQECKTARATQVHHLRYPKWGTFDTPDNLVSICYPCHCKIHGKAK